MSETEEIKQETPSAWAKITKSSSKDGGTGYEVGYSDPTGNTENVITLLAELNRRVKAIAEGKDDD